MDFPTSFVLFTLLSALETQCNSYESKSDSSHRFPDSVSHFANGLARVGHKELFDQYDFGVPMSDRAHKQDALILYDSQSSLPSDKNVAAQLNGEIPRLSAKDATENCDVMNAMFIENPARARSRQCLAIVGGQYQSYHIQRWMRLNGEEKPDSNEPLQLVGR